MWCRFESAHPGKVFASITPESEEDVFTLWKPDARLPQTAPDAVVPAGLDAQQQGYLYNSIREFVKDEHKDTLCPLPTVPGLPRSNRRTLVRTSCHHRQREDVAQPEEAGVVVVVRLLQSEHKKADD